ncbi:MAG: hypothetical protein AAF488_15185 [Planctomycetota bacterium]
MSTVKNAVTRWATLVGGILLLVSATACVPGSYVVTLRPQDGFNDGKDEKLEVHVVWTTEATGLAIASLSSDEWFDGAFRTYDKQGIVLRDSIPPGVLRPHQFRGPGDSTVLDPPDSIAGSKVTGLVLFANYTVIDADGVHAEVAPKTFWPFGPYAIEVLLQERRVVTEAEMTAAAAGAQP